MESVLELRSGLVVLRRGAERSTILVSSGILGYAFDKIQVCCILETLTEHSWHLGRPSTPVRPSFYV